jgi:hypothetical protein
MTVTTPARQKRSWIASNWKALVAILVIIVVALATIGMIYTQPWSKIRVLVYNQSSSYVVFFVIYIDGDRQEQDRWGNPLDSGIAGVWSVQTGTHRVAIDYYFTERFTAVKVDGDMNFVYEFNVGPLYTKNVFVYLSPN